jgi:hypothetical protein
MPSPDKPPGPVFAALRRDLFSGALIMKGSFRDNRECHRRILKGSLCSRNSEGV